MSIVVTGASGKLGHLVASALMARAAPSQIVLVSRSPEKLAHFAQRGVTVRRGDFDDPGALQAAFAGADRALIVSTFGPGNPVIQHRAAFQAAARAGVRRLFYTSFQGAAEDNPAPASRMQHASEQDLRATGVAWTILRNALYADLRADIAKQYIADGRWTANTGRGAHAFVHRTDCAEAAAAALTTNGHDGRAYDITGPELVDAAAYTAHLHEVAGRPIAQVDLDDVAFERYRSDFSQRPENANYIELYTGTGTAIREGRLNVLSRDFQELTGHAPHSLKELIKSAAAI